MSSNISTSKSDVAALLRQRAELARDESKIAGKKATQTRDPAEAAGWIAKSFRAAAKSWGAATKASDLDQLR